MFEALKNRAHEVLQKSVKSDYHAMVKDIPGGAEAAEWAAEKLPNRNWGSWYLKNFKANPRIHTEENRKSLEHFTGMQHLKEVKEHRFDPKHDFQTGLESLKSAEAKGLSRTSTKDTAGNPIPASGEQIIETRNGMAWFDLGKGSCSVEAAAMGHCGNEPSEKKGDRVLSLRRILPDGRHEPHLTFIENKGTIGEMKGKANMKPAPAYHDHIVDLLKHPRIKSITGGGYAQESNFDLGDLPDEKRNEVLATKPDIDLKYAPKDIVDQKFKKGLFGVSKNNIERLFSNPNITEDQLFRGLKHKDLEIRRQAMKHGEINEKHLDEAIKDPDWEIRLAAVMNRRADVRHINIGLADPVSNVRRGAISNENANENHISTAMQDPSSDLREIGAGHKNATAEHISQALKDWNAGVRHAAIRHPNATAEHISLGLMDENEYVRRAAIQNPNATSEHISKALKDEREHVRQAAIEHPNATEKQISRALSGSDFDFAAAAIKNPSVQPNHISKVMGEDGRYDLKPIAMRHPNATEEHIARGLVHHYEPVRKAAIEVAKERGWHHLLNDPVKKSELKPGMSYNDLKKIEQK